MTPATAAPPQIAFSSRARATSRSVNWAPEGHLTLADGRLWFVVGSEIRFQFPLERIDRVRTSWSQIGAGFGFDALGRTYWVSFMNLGAASSRAMELVHARRLGRAWRDVLTTALATAV